MIRELKAGLSYSTEYESLAKKAASEIYPKYRKQIWWEAMPVGSYQLESFTRVSIGESIYSTEIYKNIWNDNRYARIYLPPDLERGFVPTLMLGTAEDIEKYAKWDQAAVKNFDGKNATETELGIDLSAEDFARIPNIEAVLRNGQIKYFGRRSSFVLTRRVDHEDTKLVYKIFENLVKPEKNESFVHIMNSDESPFSTSIGGVMITNSEEYVQKALSKR